MLKYFFILYIFYYLSNCQITIPLTYFPVYEYNKTTPSEIMRSILFQKVYANIDIGTPKQKTQLPLVFDSNDFYIGKNPLKEMPKERFTDLKFYNPTSVTLEDVDPDREDYYSFNGDIFGFGIYKRDIFYFNKQEYKLDFYLAETYNEVNSGGIGLQLLPSSDIYDSATTIKKTFLGQLNNKGLTQKYFWSIIYNSNETKKEEEATLLLGCQPHEFKGNFGSYKKECFSPDNRRSIYIIFDSFNYKTIKNLINLNKIYAFKRSDNEKLIDDFNNDKYQIRQIELDYHSGGVKAPYQFLNYYREIFEEHISAGNCFNDTVNRNYFFYCKRDNKVLSKIKSVFPKVIFSSKELGYNFTLDYNDLFVEESDYVFCLLYFGLYSDRQWVMGKPFLRKYLFTIDYDAKIIIFYENSCEKQDILENSEIKEGSDIDSFIEEKKKKLEDKLKELVKRWNLTKGRNDTS